MSEFFYLTTPFFSANGVPQLGHACTAAMGDSIARYKRMCGEEVCFLSGADEHGARIERTARARQISPRQLLDHNTSTFKRTLARLNIHFDQFVRTTDSRHLAAVEEVFHRLRDNGFIYLGECSGQYCGRCQASLSAEDQACPECQGPAETVQEESYCFKLSAFKNKLLMFYQDNADFVIPRTQFSDTAGFVKGGLKDLSISRTSVQWGIPVPGDPKHVFRAWFDALVGYLSGIGYGFDEEQFQNWWPASVQLVGKESVPFHTVYWPAFLMAAGLEPPRHVLVHGWAQPSFCTPDRLAEALHPDWIRYFLLREAPSGDDGDFSCQALLRRVNRDLSDILGNLCGRVLKMIQSCFEGSIPESAGIEPRDEELVRFSKETIKLYLRSFDRFQLDKALEHVWELILVVNKYLVANSPWQQARDPSKRERLGTVLYNSAEALRIVSVLLKPVLPRGAASILGQLGMGPSLREERIGRLVWGGLKPGSSLGRLEPVYPRIKVKRLLARMASPTAPEPGLPAQLENKEERAATSGQASRIAIEDFAKVEMRVGRILKAQRVHRSDKLLKLQIDIGTETRQIVAGIGKAYTPDSLVGRLVAVVTNLKPVRLMGVESDGMCVAASVGGRPVLTTFTEAVEVGARLT
ncbi:MAG: methionine--tRNA ligase [Acidobacteriota bacterium]